MPISRWTNLKEEVNLLANKFRRRSNTAILHHGRCGSTVLGGLINQHPQMYNSSELIHQYALSMSGSDISNIPAFRSYLRHHVYRVSDPNYLFETKFLEQQHLGPNYLDMPLADYITMIRKLGFSKFIILQRVNYLKRAISVMIGLKKKVWHQSKKQEGPTRVEIEVDRLPFGSSVVPLLEYFREIDRQYELLEEMLQGQSILKLIYEDDIEKNPLTAYEKTCKFIGLSPVNVSPKLKKINPYPLDEIIINYDEVKEVVGNSEFAWMLD